MIDYQFFYSGPLLFNTTIKESDLIEIVSENYNYEIYKNDNHDYNMRLIKK